MGLDAKIKFTSKLIQNVWQCFYLFILFLQIYANYDNLRDSIST